MHHNRNSDAVTGPSLLLFVFLKPFFIVMRYPLFNSYGNLSVEFLKVVLNYE